MIFAATNPDVAVSTIGYALGAVAVGMTLVALMLYAAWTTRDGRTGLVERWLDNRLARRGARALARGDQQVLRAVEQREHFHRERVTVPRRLTERPHR